MSGCVLRDFVWLALVGCGGTVDVPDATADATVDVALDSAPMCMRVDAANCVTGAKWISCEGDGGVGSICLGDAGDNCGYGDAGCTYFCNDDEYAASCGGSPPQVSDPPSPACHSIGGLPNGSAQYCCPCQ